MRSPFILVATTNPHKLAEIREILATLPFPLRSLADFPELGEPPEDGATFEENALQKAQTIHDKCGGIVLADDSGLEVDALGGAPGVHSKRFTPEATADANNRHLLDRLSGATNRAARYRCVIALVTDGYAGTVDGTCEGSIGHTCQGTHGFGYDPLFIPKEDAGRTMAELTPDQKHRISHRGRALARLPALFAQAGVTLPSR